MPTSTAAQPSRSLTSAGATSTTVPRTLRDAAGLWITAIAAGAAETALVVAASDSAPADLAGGLAVRALIYVTAFCVALQLRRGRPWARAVLAVGLGVVGTVSLVIEPVRWLAEGHSPTAWLTAADTGELLLAALRLAHLAAVLAALALMFHPASRAYFRARRASRTAA